jgi:hypothetical protein
VWIATGIMLVGLLVGAWAVIAMSWLTGACAVAVFAVGAGLAWHGRIFRDTHSSAPVKRELRDLGDPESNPPEGFDPAEMGRLDDRSQ